MLSKENTMDVRSSRLDRPTHRSMVVWARKCAGVGMGMVTGAFLFGHDDVREAFLAIGSANLVAATVLFGWSRLRSR
jgi:hypothetical protein